MNANLNASMLETSIMLFGRSWDLEQTCTFVTTIIYIINDACSLIHTLQNKLHCVNWVTKP